MAQLLPPSPFQGSSPEVIRIFNVLRRLPDTFIVSQRFSTSNKAEPDFLLREANRLLLVAVSSATSQDVRQAQQLALFGEVTKRIGLAEETGLLEFLATFSLKTSLSVAIFFPNISAKQLQAIQPPDTAIKWVSKETLTPPRLKAWLDEHLSAPLTVSQIEHIRAKFTPEVIVPKAFTVRQPIERHTEASLMTYLLDYDQEYALKLDINLPQTGQHTAQDFQLRLINGVAGSGKSLIIIYRAYIMRQHFPHKSILILTHNRPLIHDLRRRYARLSNGDRNVKLHTFMGWCRRHWPKDKPWRKLIRHSTRLELITQIWHEHLRDTSVSEQILLDEIDWYKDRLLFSEADYLAANRSGRGFALGSSMRQRIFHAMNQYHEMLQQRKLMDWGDVPRQLWRFWHTGEVALPRYDVILIDEAQFFAPLWFEIIKRLLTPDTGHLFLVADPSQGFLKRKQSWLSSGLEVRGRVHRLTKSYRTTREILDFATLLYRSRLPDDEEDVVVPDVYHMPNGVLPVVIPLTSEQDEITRVVNEVKQLHQSGIPWRDILIIHANYEETSQITGRLNRAFRRKVAVDPGRENPNDQIRVCSLNSATGLESPIVFLMGIHDLYEREQSIRLSDEERATVIRDNTRKLYMACTRAGQRLIITYVGPLPEMLTEHLPINT